MSDNTHREPITGLAWITSKRSRKSQTEASFVLTASETSKILLWRSDRLDQPVKLLRVDLGGESRKAGLLCLSLSPVDG